MLFDEMIPKCAMIGSSTSTRVDYLTGSSQAQAFIFEQRVSEKHANIEANGHFAVLKHSIDQAATYSHLDLISIGNCLLSPKSQQISFYSAVRHMIGDGQCYYRC